MDIDNVELNLDKDKSSRLLTLAHEFHANVAYFQKYYFSYIPLNLVSSISKFSLVFAA